METGTLQAEGTKIPEAAGMSHATLTTATLDTIIEVLNNQEAKINIILENSERMRRASIRSMWITIIFFVLPLVISVVMGVLLFKSLSASGISLESFNAYANMGGLVEELQKAQAGQSSLQAEGALPE